MADTQLKSFSSQGLPDTSSTYSKSTSTCQRRFGIMWMKLMQGSGRTLQQRKEDLFDEYERFRAIGNESIHDYFVRFHKLVNDMKITQLEIPYSDQMNTKFVNNLPAYWGKYVTNVKQNMDISTTPYVQIYTHLKAYEPHAKKTLKKQEQSTSIVDPLAYVAHTTSAPALSSPSTPSPQHTAQSPNDALMATMTQIANLLSGFQKQFPPTNNQLRTSSNSKTHATVHDGQIVTEPIQRKAPGNVGNTGARGKKHSSADVECTAPYDQPQALTTTNMFQANHEDAYDSDVDEGPNAAVAFMANLSSTSATNSQVNEVHSNDNPIFDNVDYQLSQEMHQVVIQLFYGYLYSGCSRHMTVECEWRLINFVEKFTIVTNEFGNDEYVAIVAMVIINWVHHHLSVYYVEGLKHNQFSVGTNDSFVIEGLEDAFRQHSFTSAT
ncbi:hypothetical protein Tco_1276116 [Tanacetum coccineum]